jgi:hypothetical protein
MEVKTRLETILTTKIGIGPRFFFALCVVYLLSLAVLAFFVDDRVTYMQGALLLTATAIGQLVLYSLREILVELRTFKRPK